MSFPTLTNPDWLENAPREELEALVSQITGFLRKDHKSNGHHGDIEADSVTSSGVIEANSTENADRDSSIVQAKYGDGIVRLIVESEEGGGRTAVIFVPLTNNPNALDAGLLGEVIGPDTFSHNDNYPTAASTADSTKAPVALLSDLVPIADDSLYLGYQGTGDFQRRWRSGYFSDIVEAAKLRATTVNGVYEGSRSAAMGERIAVAHNDANFGGNSVGTLNNADWVVDSADQVTFSYSRVGKEMFVAFVIANSDVANAPTALQIAIPGGLIADVRCDGVVTIVNAGGAAVQGQCFVSAAGTVINIQLNSGAAFTNTTADNTNVTGQIRFWTTT